MQSVTADFLTAAKATIRKPKARCKVTWADGLIDNVEVLTGGQENYTSWPSQVIDGIETVPYKWFHLDGTTPLSEGTRLAPGTAADALNNQMGWWGADECDSAPYELADMPESANIVGMWKFDEGSGTTAADEAGNHDMIIGASGWGSSAAAGLKNCIIDNAGANDAFSELYSATEMTISYWIKHDTLGETNVQIKAGNSPSGFQAYTGPNGDISDGLSLSFYNGGIAYIQHSSACTAGQWHHICWVFDGAGATDPDRCKLYVDGVAQVLSFSILNAVPAALAAAPWFSVIQANVFGSDKYLDQMVVWDKALTAPQVATIAAEAGVFTTPQTLDLRFAARPMTTLRIVGDDAWNEYPADFTVQIYTGSGGATLSYTLTVTGNEDLIYTNDLSAEGITDCTRMVLSISRWSLNGRVVKITEFNAPVTITYDGSEIMTLNITEESEVKTGTISTGNISANEMDIALNNTDDKFFPGNTDATLHELMRKNRKLEPELGFELADGSTEWVVMGVFWSGDWAASELGTSTSTTARDRMERLRKTFITATYTSYTLKQIATAILDDARTYMPDIEYSVSDDLSSYSVPSAEFDNISHFDAIKKVTEACLGRAYADRSGVVQVLGPESGDPADAYDLDITQSMYFNRTQPANSEEVANFVSVTTADGLTTETAQDADSIQLFGRQEFVIKDRDLIQSSSVASDIAAALLAVYKDKSKDVELDWRGNPAMELTDVIRTVEYKSATLEVLAKFKIWSQTFAFDGTLRCTLKGRKIAGSDITAIQVTMDPADDAIQITMDPADDAIQVQY